MWTLFQSNPDVYIQCSVWLSLSEGWGASCPGWFILPPTQDLGQAVSLVSSYCSIILEYIVVRDINIISVKLKCLHPRFSLVIFVWGVGEASCPSWFILPPPRIWSSQCHQSITLEYLVVRDVNNILFKLRVQAGSNFKGEKTSLSRKNREKFHRTREKLQLSAWLGLEYMFSWMLQ